MKSMIKEATTVLLLVFFLADQVVEKVRGADRISLVGTFNTNQCRRCLDHFNNSYYCATTAEPVGACCPFPKEGASLPKQINPVCIHSAQLGQTCSHRLEADAIGTSREELQREISIASYLVCKQDTTRCGGTSVLQIAAPVVDEHNEHDDSVEAEFEWKFKDMKPD